MAEVEEVTEHPIISVLEKANDSPFLNGFSAKLLTLLYLEIVGESYWYVQNDVLGRPVNIWPIPSQYLRPVKDTDSKKIVDRYEFRCGSVTQDYAVEEIIQFILPDLNDPYKTGYSSTKASTEATLVGNKLISHELGILENQARPDAIVSPEKDQVFGVDEAARYEKMLNAKFGRGNGGKVLVAEEALKWTPIVFPPKDLAAMEINKWSKTEIANAKGVPLALLEAVQINRATLEAAMEQHARYTVKPRCDLIAAVLNDQFVSKYDESGRLFLCFDDCVPESREQQMTECVQYVQNRIITPNEARYEIGYPPIEGGDELMSINDAGRGGAGGSSSQRQDSRDSGSAEK